MEWPKSVVTEYLEKTDKWNHVQVKQCCTKLYLVAGLQCF